MIDNIKVPAHNNLLTGHRLENTAPVPQPLVDQGARLLRARALMSGAERSLAEQVSSAKRMFVRLDDMSRVAQVEKDSSARAPR